MPDAKIGVFLTKLLLTATVPGHLSTFHLPLARELSRRGWTVDTAADGPVDDLAISASHVLPWTRSPFSFGNVRAYRQLKGLLDREHYDVVYAHTPVGGVITRLAARNARKHGTRVAYMAHGFHFYRGAPLRLWALYYPVERLLARLADDLLVINQEDYARANSQFKTNVHATRGVGIDAERFTAVANQGVGEGVRAELGLVRNRKVVLAVGELNANKNHELLIRSWPELLASGVDAELLIAGEGVLRPMLEALIESLGLSDRVRLLGTRDDVPELLAASDLVVSASQREGLPQNVLEAMTAEKPVLVSPIRGHVDLVTHGTTGFITQGFEVDEWSLALKTLLTRPQLLARVGATAWESARKYALPEAMEPVLEVLDPLT